MNSSRVIPLTARILLLSLVLLVANSSAFGSVISAYAYSNASQPSDGIHDLSNKITNTGMIDNVYLIAVDVDSVGGVHVKNEEQNRFYPYFWTGKPSPTFTANINVDAHLDWTVHNPTQNLIQQLGQNNWKQDFDGDIHVDAEFVMDVTTMPSNWVDCMTSLKTYANQQGRNFSMYFNPKYLSVTDKYTSADVDANIATLKSILSPATAGASNHVVFPVYADNQINAKPQILKDAAKLTVDNKLGYEWIHDITQTTPTFNEGMASAHEANLVAKYTPAGVSVFQFTSKDNVTQTMLHNLSKLQQNPNSIPEPASCLIWCVGAVLFSLRWKSHRFTVR